MELLTANQLIPPAAEPMRENRWIVEFGGIDAWHILTFERPKGDFGEIKVDYINTIRYWQGKWTPQTSAMTLWDPIVPSASQKLQEWLNLCHEQPTGRAGFKEYYAGKNFKLKMLDPAGGVIQRWDFYNIFPTSYDYGRLDYGSPEKMIINLTLRWESCILMY